MNGGSARAHVLLVPSPSQGHTIPFMNLMKQLVRNGLSVTFVSSEKHIASLEQAKENQKGGDGLEDRVRFVGLPGGPVNFVDLFDERKDEKMARMLGEFISKSMQKTEGEVEEQVGVEGHNAGGSMSTLEGAPCCIISDMFGGWTHAVAKKFGIPSHVLFTSPAACASMQLQIPKFIADGVLPLPTSNKKGPVSIPGLPLLNPKDLPSDLICEELSPQYKFYTRNTLRLSDATCVLVNTFYDLEKSVFDVVKSQILNSSIKVKSIVPVGPLLPVERHVRPDARHPAEIWLDTQKHTSVLYVAFGSGIVFSPEQILELSQGLEASQQPFVLVLQPPKSDFKSIYDYFPPGFEGRTEGRGFVVTDWAPQVRILNHPATGAFMTHCGWNSSLESIVAGVPLIAWPMMAEQKMNCRFLVDTAKLAIEVCRQDDVLVTSAEVERVVRLLMQESVGSDIHIRANKMQDLAHQAVAPGGSSQKSMESFIKEITTSMCTRASKTITTT